MSRALLLNFQAGITTIPADYFDTKKSKLAKKIIKMIRRKR